MDAIELARREAERLHAEGVSFGDDAWNSYDFVVSQAQRKGLTVSAVAPDSPLLDGVLARYDPDADLIIHARNGSLFDQAVYVAHELGHAVLGDGQADTACEIDPSRPVEASPVGEDRVLDYSRRQRREVQMDLFARELVLPRSVARRLHVDEGLTASVIAERLGAPFMVVAQQLLDALLLPRSRQAPRSPGQRRRRTGPSRTPPDIAAVPCSWKPDPEPARRRPWWRGLTVCSPRGSIPATSSS